MNANRLVFDGRRRLKTSAGYLQRKSEVEAKVRERFAARLSNADFFSKLWIYWELRCELNREIRDLEPSPETLW